MSISSDQDPRCGVRSVWLLPLLLAIVLAAILLTQHRAIRKAVFNPASGSLNAPPVEHEHGTLPEHVFLTINFGDGRPLQNEAAAWREGMTVGDLLQSEPRVSLAVQGSEASTFLKQLGGVENEGAGGRNWIYSVNGKPADRSFAVYELKPNDHVLWTFARDE